MSKKRIHWLRLLAALAPIACTVGLYPLSYLGLWGLELAGYTQPIVGFWDKIELGLLTFIALCLLTFLVILFYQLACGLFEVLYVIGNLLFNWIYNDK